LFYRKTLSARLRAGAPAPFRAQMAHAEKAAFIAAQLCLLEMVRAEPAPIKVVR
jgi:hypothetical protein